jgi:hypothetical protein
MHKTDSVLIRTFKSDKFNNVITDFSKSPTYIKLEVLSSQMGWDTCFVDKDRLPKLIKFLQEYQEALKNG